MVQLGICENDEILLINDTAVTQLTLPDVKTAFKGAPLVVSRTIQTLRYSFHHLFNVIVFLVFLKLLFTPCSKMLKVCLPLH